MIKIRKTILQKIKTKNIKIKHEGSMLTLFVVQ